MTYGQTCIDAVNKYCELNSKIENRQQIIAKLQAEIDNLQSEIAQLHEERTLYKPKMYKEIIKLFNDENIIPLNNSSYLVVGELREFILNSGVDKGLLEDVAHHLETKKMLEKSSKGVVHHEEVEAFLSYTEAYALRIEEKKGEKFVCFVRCSQ